MSKKECRNCEFYHDSALTKASECRLYPPKVHPLPMQDQLGRVQVQLGAAWAGVKPSDWCGQFKEKQPGLEETN